ncbi:5-hydroxytryptamine receptor 3A-like [Salarias fasciatus]|uniref:5-hydroxytryptamine receptor 3A-like n=1 Tax=Salarias fasciatus TaxID=181472 RepID=UPI001176DD4B|nr:5-hydroxytryptamine receptor 3A-like [Salarias fasciatus]
MKVTMEKNKIAELLCVCFMLSQGLAATLNCSSPTAPALFRELERNLFPEHLMRPVETFSTPINITLGITVVGILGLDEKSQTLSTVLWEVLEWDIYGLNWDEQECGTKRVSVPRDKLWIPDILIAELLGDNNYQRTPYVYLYNTGHVYDDKPISMVSSCRLNIYTFPFDIQNCSLTFGSYLHFADDIRLIQGSSSEDILQESRDVMETSGEWELADINVAGTTLALESGEYSEIQFFIVLRRRPILYVVNLLIPSGFLITVDLFSFLLPPQSVDRCSFKMTLILGYTVFLLIMNDLLPVTGETTPLINVFFSISLALMVASLLETIFITNIQFASSQYGTVPHWLKVLVLRYLVVIVCLRTKEKTTRITVCIGPSNGDIAAVNTISTNSSGTQIISNNTLPDKLTPAPPDPPHHHLSMDLLKKLSRDLAAIRLQMEKHFQGSIASQEWQMIGTVIDRLLFILYIVFILSSFITISGIWIWNNSYST